MCKFHKDVAIAIATDPETGKFDAGRYAVTQVVLARFHLESYMPEMFNVVSYSPYEVSTPQAVAALEKSGLARPQEDILAYRYQHAREIRAALNAVAQKHDLSPEGLSIPADPLKYPRITDEAQNTLYDGCDAHGYAEGEVTLKTTAPNPKLEALRAAAQTLAKQPGVVPILKQMLEDSIAKVFRDGQKNSKPLVAKVYNMVPRKLRDSFRQAAACGKCAVGGHALCLAFMGAAALGSTVAAVVVSNIWLVSAMSVAAAAGGYAAWNRRRGGWASPRERAFMRASCTLAAAGMITMHLPVFGGHNHGPATSPEAAHHMHHAPKSPLP